MKYDQIMTDFLFCRMIKINFDKDGHISSTIPCFKRRDSIFFLYARFAKNGNTDWHIGLENLGTIQDMVTQSIFSLDSWDPITNEKNIKKLDDVYRRYFDSMIY